eukprot:CAMPEP_0173430414 /NCGR_PEP_ID=MMETSP1357-20121228/8842_1 /TAXON_ID=77926 /ORGANISM="Hemiselmis rufescens, Strain PCC563" /LENGTH=72 /DNA_ID=CAMNT_0014394743 /DNA_START=698 /DNA_END=916 /DNA_ORIENTATION=-
MDTLQGPPLTPGSLLAKLTPLRTRQTPPGDARRLTTLKALSGPPLNPRGSNDGACKLAYGLQTEHPSLYLEG